MSHNGKNPEGHPLAPWLPPPEEPESDTAEEAQAQANVPVKRPLSPFAGISDVPKRIKIK